MTNAEGTGCDLPALTATPRPLLRIPPDPASQMLPFLSNEDESHLQKLTSTKPFPRTKCAPDTKLSAFNVFSLISPKPWARGTLLFPFQRQEPEASEI